MNLDYKRSRIVDMKESFIKVDYGCIVHDVGSILVNHQYYQ